MRFARLVFLVAGVYGIAVMAPMYFMEERIGRDMPPPINHPEYFYGFLGVTLAWQLLFLMLAKDPLRYRPMMMPATVEKVSYGIALVLLHLKHRLSTRVLQVGSLDWVFAVLFVAAYVATRRNTWRRHPSV